jgi:hypothetical protein
MKSVKKLEKFRRKAWLAGIAAYDATVDAATDKLDKIYVDGNAFVNSLVDKGASLEAELQLKLGARSMLDEKIAALRAKLGMNKESRDQQLDHLSAKLDGLIEVVAKFAQQQAAQKSAAKLTETSTTATKAPAAKPAVAKKPAAKPATKTAAKPATKTAAKPAPKAAAKPAPKAAAKPAPKAAAKPAPKVAETKPKASPSADKPAG